MKTKKMARFDVGKILEVAEQSLLRLWIVSEKKLDRWMENTSKRKSPKKQKLPKKSIKVLAKEREEASAVQREINQKKRNERFSQLEAQNKEKQQEYTIDIDH
jgi:hypothetical protein